jgi:hypothetical protein
MPPRRKYSGVNVLILWGAVIERGFSVPSWLTFGQALQVDTTETHRVAAVIGMGFVPVPDWLVADALAAGQFARTGRL